MDGHHAAWATMVLPYELPVRAGSVPRADPFSLKSLKLFSFLPRCGILHLQIHAPTG